MIKNLDSMGRRVVLSEGEGRSVFLGKDPDGNYILEFSNVHETALCRSAVKVSKEAMDAVVLLYETADLSDAALELATSNPAEMMRFVVKKGE